MPKGSASGLMQKLVETVGGGVNGKGPSKHAYFEIPKGPTTLARRRLMTYIRARQYPSKHAHSQPHVALNACCMHYTCHMHATCRPKVVSHGKPNGASDCVSIVGINDATLSLRAIIGRHVGQARLTGVVRVSQSSTTPQRYTHMS